MCVQCVGGGRAARGVTEVKSNIKRISIQNSSAGFGDVGVTALHHPCPCAKQTDRQCHEHMEANNDVNTVGKPWPEPITLFVFNIPEAIPMYTCLYTYGCGVQVHPGPKRWVAS